MDKLKTLCFGEILFDRIDGDYHFGGAPVNVAIHLARLGARSSILSAVSRDELGLKALSVLEKEGVVTNFLHTDSSKPTGTVDAVIRDGMPFYDIKENVAWDSIQIANKAAIENHQWDLLYCGTLAQRTEENRNTLKYLMENLCYRQLFFDVNLRQHYFSREIIEETLAYTTILKLSVQEQPVLSRLLFEKELDDISFFAELIALYPLELMILTRGAEGSDFYFQAIPDEVFSCKTGSVDVVDTVGAGDSFSGTFLYFFLNGDRLYKAAEKASLMADYIVSHSGALPVLDSRIKRELGLLA